jgi:4'-phosphopantetheinyl transferase
MTLQAEAGSTGAELWLVDLDDAAPALDHLERARPRLGASERAAILARRDPLERRRRLAAHVALRVVLERLLGSGVCGRELLPGRQPRLEGYQVDLSLSHADDLALIGVGLGCRIGVDLERLRAIVIAPDRRRLILRAAAALAPAAAHAAGSDCAFLRAWVRLEALAKASGHGLALTLSELGLWHAGRPRGGQLVAVDVAVLARQHLAKTGLGVHDLAPAAGAVAAVALSAGMRVPPLSAFPATRAQIAALIDPPAV